MMRERLAALGRRMLTLNVALQVIGASCGLIGNSFINEQSVFGFYLWMLSNGALIWLQLRMRMWVLVALHGAYLTLAIDGAYKWGGLG